MSGFILGEKSNQSQDFDSKGDRIPTTFIKTTPCYLIDVKIPQEGYFVIKLGFGQTKNIKKTTLGELNKAGIKTPLRFLKEFKVKESDSIKVIEEEVKPDSAKATTGKRGFMINDSKIYVGDELKPSTVFKKGELIDVSGISKGKGFQGVVKRHGFAGGPRTHGQSDRERAPGSIGQTTTPGRVYKGKRMAGRMGGVRITVKNLEIIDVKDQGLSIKGLVPGAKGGLLEILNIK